MDADDILQSGDELADKQLLADALELLTIGEESRPRNLQREIGPSGMGDPCDRSLAYQMVHARLEPASPLVFQAKGINTKRDPLASIFGTALHGVAEEGARLMNQKLGRKRWIAEAKVEIRPGLSGTCDLYDTDTHTVLDWKFPGTTIFADKVKNGPGEVYECQAHGYGRGYRRIGFPVKKVGILFVCRTGTMRSTHLWRTDYDDSKVDAALARLDHIVAQINEFGVDRDPNNFLRIPITPSDNCRYCSHWSPAADGPWQCAGKEETRHP